MSPCRWIVSLAVGLIVAVSPATAAVAMTLPDGYVEEAVADLPDPVGLAFAPDGRLLVTQQHGLLRVVRPDGTLVAQPALDLTGRICANSERGLVGVEVAPDFAVTGHVYVYWTVKGTSECDGYNGGYGGGKATNRVSRFTMIGDVIDPASEVVILDKIPNAGHIHNAGDLEFGKDGKLYVSVGDGGCNYRTAGLCGAQNAASRDVNALVGKVLRVNPDGTTPPDNPFAATGQPCRLVGVGASGVPCSETYLRGLRNPFRFAFDPNVAGVKFYVMDVGQSRWEEVDEAIAGADYGWNMREGNCATGSLTDCGPHWTQKPLYAYGRDTGCTSVVGGAFVPNGAWAPQMNGQFLFTDFTCGTIFQLVPNGSGGSTVTPWATGLGSPTTMVFGPDGAMYVSSFASGITRIRYVGAGNRPPIARVSASPRSGGLPLRVTFDASASADPDGDPLTYLWDFGDGTTAETATPTTTHTFSTAALRTVTLRVRDDEGATSSASTVTVDAGNTAPVPEITSLAEGATFTANGAITLTGKATDGQDGALPGSALSWEVRRHHDEHWHPWFSGTGATADILGPEPEDLPAADGSWLEVRLTATDSRGLSTTVTRRVDPRKRALTVITEPPGLNVTVNEKTAASPITVTSWPGTIISVAAAGRQVLGGQVYDLTGWSDGGGASHSFTMPDAATTVTASYEAPAPGTTGLRATYYDNVDFTARSRSVVEPALDFRWGGGAPAGVGADSWSATYEGKLLVPQGGAWKFYTRADDGVRLFIDGTLVISQWTLNLLQPEQSKAITLTPGAHDLRVEYVDRSGGASLQVSWLGPGIEAKTPIGPAYLTPAPARDMPAAQISASPSTGTAPLDVTLSGAGSSDPLGHGLTYVWDFGDGTSAETTSATIHHTYAVGTFTASLRVRDAEGETSEPVSTQVVAALAPSASPGLKAEYFDNVDFTASKLVRVETTLEQRWGNGAPPGIAPDSWTARFVGRLRVPQTGTWRIYGRADDGFRIAIDGKLAVSQWTLNLLQPERSVSLPLIAGEHELVVEYVDRSGGASLVVSWLGPGVPAKTPIAGAYLVQPPPLTP